MNLPTLFKRKDLERSSYDAALSFDDFVGLVTQFSFNGVQYTQPGNSQEDIAPAFLAMSRAAYKSNGIVFACMAVRQMLLSEARFCFRERRNGRPGNLYTTAALAPLEKPWPGAHTGDLIKRMEIYASLGGNWFGTNRYGGVRSLRPDWMKIILGSDQDYTAIGWDPDAVPIGYAYQPGGPGSGRDPIIFLPEEIAHYAPYPDPEAQFRGMSWLTPIVREVMSDKAATDHKLMFFENGATPNMVVKMDVEDINQWVNWIRKFSDDHDGVRNAYKTMYLGAGMDASVVGSNLQQLDFKATQGAGETRIAAAARVPAAIAQISEGLQGSTLNSGNFDASMRMLSDMMARPSWRDMAGSLEPLIVVPGGSELWYDDRDIPALQEDIKKAGERALAQAQTINTYVLAGFEADSAVDAVTSGDLSRLVHSGMTSVQMLPPGKPSTPDPAANGNGATPALNGANGSRDHEIAALERQLALRERPLEFHAHMPDQPAPNVIVPVNVEAPLPSHTTIEAARAPDVHLNVEPAKVDVQVDAPITVEAAPAPSVEFGERSIVVEPAEVHVDVAAAPAPNVEVHVEQPEPRKGKRKVDLGDGRSAMVTGTDDGHVIDFGDRKIVVTEEDQ